jgi:hypothetical protein
MKRKLFLLLILLFGLAGGIIITIRTNVSSPPQTKTKRASDFRADSEPAGFRGIPWLVDLSKLSNMKPISKGKIFTIYECNDEVKKIGNANIEYIKYWTLHDKFVKVEIRFRGEENWDLIKKIVFERFGPGRKGIEEDRVYYSWSGVDVSVSLVFGTKLKYGDLDFMHSYILKAFGEKIEEIIEIRKKIEQLRKERKELLRKEGLPTDDLEDF